MTIVEKLVENSVENSVENLVLLTTCIKKGNGEARAWPFLHLTVLNKKKK